LSDKQVKLHRSKIIFKLSFFFFLISVYDLVKILCRCCNTCTCCCPCTMSFVDNQRGRETNSGVTGRPTRYLSSLMLLHLLLLYLTCVIGVVHSVMLFPVSKWRRDTHAYDTCVENGSARKETMKFQRKFPHREAIHKQRPTRLCSCTYWNVLKEVFEDTIIAVWRFDDSCARSSRFPLEWKM
jgi:hypothetical protein